MKEIPLSNGGVALVDDDVFEWAKEYKWHRHSQGYPYRHAGHGRKNAKTLKLHTEILGNAPVGRVTDHINQNPLDNRRGNLRFVPRRVNMLNSSKSKNVFYNKQKNSWQVRFRLNHHRYSIDICGLSSEAEALSIAALMRGALLYNELTKGRDDG